MERAVEGAQENKKAPPCRAEREFPALLVFWGYQQNSTIFGGGQLIFRA